MNVILDRREILLCIVIICGSSAISVIGGFLTGIRWKQKQQK